MLHDHAIAAVLRAIPTARVGGPDIAGGAGGTYLGDFLDHCSNGSNLANKTGTQLDFISFHAKGAPLFVNSSGGGDGYIQMNVSTQLQQIGQAFQVIASFPQYKSTPIIMSEYDPDGCAACTSPAYGYRNGLPYPAYTAASFIRAMDLAAAHGVNLQGALTWAFEYEQTALLPNETGLFDGFRVLSTQGIDKPVLNVHRMWGMMSGDRILANSSGQVPMDVVLRDGILGNETDVGVVSTFNSTTETLHVFVWNYHDKDIDFPDANVSMVIQGFPSGFANNGGNGTVFTHYRIDNNYSNSYARWQGMGSPQTISDEQYQELVQAGKLETLSEPQSVAVTADGVLSLNFGLPVRAMSLIVLQSGSIGSMVTSAATSSSSRSMTRTNAFKLVVHFAVMYCFAGRFPLIA